jgi:hypothetical protein
MGKFDFRYYTPMETNENGFFDAGKDLTTSTRSVQRLIELIDRRVGLDLRAAPLWGSRGSFTRLLHQIHNGQVVLPCCFTHSDFTGCIGGIIAAIIAGTDFGGFLFRGGLGQFGEEQTAVTGKGTTAKIQRDSCRFGASFRDGQHFPVQAESAEGAVGMQDDLFVNRVDFEFGENVVVQEFDGVEDGQLTPDGFVFCGEFVAAGAEGVRAGGGVNDDGMLSVFGPFPHLHQGFMQGGLIGLFVSL